MAKPATKTKLCRDQFPDLENDSSLNNPIEAFFVPTPGTEHIAHVFQKLNIAEVHSNKEDILVISELVLITVDLHIDDHIEDRSKLRSSCSYMTRGQSTPCSL